MSNNLQELTDKIYQEGILKAKSEAETIIAKAKSEAETIIAQANKQKEQTLASAKQETEEIKKNMQAELQLYAKQSVEALKSEIVNLLNERIASDSVKAATADAEFMKKMILTLVQSWAQNQQITLLAPDTKALTSYFQANAKDLLNKQVRIKQVNSTKTSFEISPEGVSYKIIFGEDELIAYFKEFLRPQLVKFLF